MDYSTKPTDTRTWFEPSANIPYMETIPQRIARRLRELMDTRPDLDTQGKVGKKVGMSQSSVGRILSQQQNLTIESIEKLAAAFDISPHHLLLERDELALLQGFAKLNTEDRAKVLGFLAVTNQPPVQEFTPQLNFGTRRAIPPSLQAASARGAERPPGADPTSREQDNDKQEEDAGSRR